MPVSKVSVIVVAFRSAETIDRCISSLPEDAEIIVVENVAESDNIGETALPPRVYRVRNEINTGFGRACNQGIEIASGDYALILNPDAWADSAEDVARLSNFMEQNADCVAVGGRLMLSNGKVQLSCARELTLWRVFLEQALLEKIAFGYWIDTAAVSQPVEVPQVTGACFMMKRINGDFLRFDDRFFLYCEDTELMKRLATHGNIYHEPNAVFHHELGASSIANRWFAVACYNRGKELYFEIHHGKLSSFLCFTFNRLGALLRLLIWTVATLATLGRFRKFIVNAAMFAKVLFAPLNIYREANKP